MLNFVPPLDAIYPVRPIPRDLHYHYVTGAIDVQADRLEVQLQAWGDGFTRICVYDQIKGDVSQNNVWSRADKYMTGWEFAGLPVRMMVVDAGFMAAKAYEFVKRHSAERVCAVKGRNDGAMVRPLKFYDYCQNSVQISGIPFRIVNSGLLRENFYQNFMPNCDNPMSFYFDSMPISYFHGLFSEVCQEKYENGQTMRYWMRIYKRNEPLDLMAYNFAARHVVEGLADGK
jgi:phage terminase large subunit GpA-like protein